MAFRNLGLEVFIAIVMKYQAHLNQAHLASTLPFGQINCQKKKHSNSKHVAKNKKRRVVIDKKKIRTENGKEKIYPIFLHRSMNDHNF